MQFLCIRRLFAVALLLFAVNIPTFGLLVDDIQLDLLSSDIYSEASQNFDLTYSGTTGTMDSIIATGLVSTTNSPIGEYLLTGGSVALTPCQLQEDETGSLALGRFAGGATLTITGTLSRLSDSVIVANGTILTAQMAPDDWYLRELQPNPAPANTFRGQAFFTTTGGALHNGANDDNLDYNNFRMDMSFEFCTPDVTDFTSFGGAGGTDYYSCPGPQLQLIPEPATIGLLAVGFAAICRKRK